MDLTGRDIRSAKPYTFYLYSISAILLFLCIEFIAIMAVIKITEFNVSSHVRFLIFLVPIFVAGPLFDLLKVYRRAKKMIGHANQAVSLTEFDLWDLAFHYYVTMTVVCGALFSLMATLRR
ncbi:MAG TPA: hypothetical protein VKP58_05005 [Candidatus Acidoferrum sp.]|nr:hypothetical protein [Candidatus Acidoferrum sp.]